MLAEVSAAVLLGALALWLVLWPMFAGAPARPRPVEPPDPEETARGMFVETLPPLRCDVEDWDADW